MTPDRVIRAIDLQTEFDEFEELCVTSFGEGTNPSKAMYEWLFDENPYNPPAGNLMFVMRDMDSGAKMIASDGLIPFELKLSDRTVLAAHSVKSMTHPDYKRQGIFRTMTDNSLRRGKEAGVRVVLGFANANSYPAYQKWGWTTLFEREVYVYPVSIENKLRGIVKSRLLAKATDALFQAAAAGKRARRHALDSFSIRTFERIPDDAQTVWDNCGALYENCIVRDLNYLRFRYDERPDASYTTLMLYRGNLPAGYAVLRQSVAREKPMVCVAENFTDPHDETCVAALAEAIIDYSRGCGADYAVVCSGRYGKFDEVFRRYGFVPRKGQGTVVIVRSLDPEISEEALVGAEHWHISQGDGESELDL